MHYFMSFKVGHKLDLLMERIDKPINVQFVKDESYEMKDVTLHVTLKS